MIVSGTRCLYKDIYKATWVSPDQRTRNKIDRVVIDGGHVSNVMNVRVMRKANIDAVHHITAAKVHT